MTLKVSSRELVAAAEAQIETLSVDDAGKLLNDDNYQLVDIRDIRELQREGRIPGSFHAPRGMLEFWVDPDSPYFNEVFAADKTFVLYCRSGWRSALATKTLQDMGMDKVCHIGGGFGAWMKADAPVEPLPEKK